MTDQRLRELLEERVADITTVDLVAGAWERASGIKRRRRVLVGLVAAVVAVVGGTSLMVAGRGDQPPPPVTSSPTETPRVPNAEREGKYGGVPVWEAPSVEEEADLPRLTGSALPEEIDLRDGAPAAPVGMRAVGLFQLWGEVPGRVIVVGADGTSYSLDVSSLESFEDVRGNVLPPVSQESLSPDGRYALFRQTASIEVYDFATGGWTTILPGDAYFEHARWRGTLIEVPRPAIDPDSAYYRPDGTRAGGTDEWDIYVGPRNVDEPYGPIRRSSIRGVRGLFLSGRSTDALGVGGKTQPESLLAMPVEPGGGRWKQCCPAVGWLDPATVLFESRHANARILAWRVGTEDLFRVSDVRGWTPGEESYLASFADPSRRGAGRP